MIGLVIFANKPSRDSRSERLTNSRIHVGPLSALEDLCDRTRARYIISVINERMLPPTPPGIKPENHLRLGLNDIVVPTAGLVPPRLRHARAIAEFARLWSHDGPMIIHCLAGISRSTASAFIALCALNPSIPESLIARKLREAAPAACPNTRLVTLGDQVLKRQGRMVEAIQSIAPPTEFQSEAEPFFLPSCFHENEQ